ncbi:hypothetical protein [Fluviicola taffensis]|uniref:Uncharacterized protein n=1 Tax=Fluviicola taffensis (strain DSM 16823 / NCIMB 13979 / RW262) TaxID=755732 RepID=F2IGI1_FLUTR|nr:hypothetical protein [Fluviicola taffensis]AEA42587.1 hypothetical protein Fluta_0583 [Fluviicola taffensis DSM 16823]
MADGPINCFSNDLDVVVNAIRRPRFKAGAELSSAVNLVGIDVEHDLLEDAEKLTVRVKIQSKTCETKECNC